jgi:uncharacterized protein YggE
MNNKGWLFACVALLSIIGGPARSTEIASPSPGGQIAVSGTGSVTIPPTTASLSITITTTNSTAALASEDNARTSKAVSDALGRSELKPGDIKGSRLTVGPRWDYEEGRRPRRSAYEATNTIKVETENLSALGAVIDVALGAGASEISDVSFSSRDIESARASALTKAVQASRNEAEVIARANGGSLGALVLMNTQPRPRGYGLEEVVVTANRKRGSTVVPSQIAPEDITVTSRIEGRWLFVPTGSK